MGRPYSSERSCSPTRRRGRKGGADSPATKSCFSYQSLAAIARHYNSANPNDKIRMSRKRDELWRAIREKTTECDDERCWLRADWVPGSTRKKLVEDFKPPLPLGKYTWLNTDDIDRVLHQYESVFPEFAYMGAHPIDFQKLYKRFNPLDVRKLRKAGKSKVGMVLNLDESHEPGSHWVALFLDLKRRSFEYYDSYGERAPREVKAFYEQLAKLDGSKDIRWSYKENTKEHQQANSECGVYSIHFIVRRLSGTSFRQAVNDIIRDEQMNRMRLEYFDPYEEYDNN